MLVLTRKHGESIRIGDSIIVTVCSIEEDKVQIGIQAPREIKITRPEWKKRKEKESGHE